MRGVFCYSHTLYYFSGRKHHYHAFMAKKYNMHLKGYVGGYDFDPDYVDYMASRYAGEHLEVLIDSRGGDLASGLSIASAFRRHGDVHVHYTGLNASAATVAGLGAKSVSIDRHSMFLVHKASLTVFEWASKNADQLADMIEGLAKMKDDLDKVDANMASYYAQRCKKPAADLLELMRVGGWLTSAEALEWGFVDEVTDDVDEPAKLDAATVTAFEAAGVPIPDMPAAPAADNALERLLSTIKSMFAQFRLFNNQTTEYMNKVFANICALLACESIVLTDSSASLTEEQLDTIEQHMGAQVEKIAGLSADVATRDARITELEARVAELEAEPAQTPGNAVIENGTGGDEADDYAATMRAARELYARV